MVLSVGPAFIFIAAVSFLGFAIFALFDRIRITSVLPLMLIGLIIGPVLHLINTSADSTIATLTPYIIAIAVSFVLFDVGLNIRFKSLSKVLIGATRFLFVTQIFIGLATAGLMHVFMGWSLIYSLIFGFAVSGPSTITIPMLVKKLNVSDNIKTTMVYESTISDVLQLIVPLTLIGIVLNPLSITLSSIGDGIFTQLMGGVLLGVISAFFWLYILNRFGDYSQNYSWILTVTMIIATYGIASYIGLNSALAVFVFGILFANIGSRKSVTDGRVHDPLGKYFATKQDVEHTTEYQREMVFFVSTFFFVYIGLLFNISSVTYAFLAIAVVLTLIMFLVRIPLTPLLGKILSTDKKTSSVEKSLIYFNIPRGLSPAIIATVPLVYGLVIPGFVNLIFLVILFTNIAFTIGVFMTYKPVAAPQQPPASPAPAKAASAAKASATAKAAASKT